MPNIRTANNAARRRLARTTYEEGKTFHEKQIERMSKSGTLHKLRDTRYSRHARIKINLVRRQMRRITLPLDIQII